MRLKILFGMGFILLAAAAIVLGQDEQPEPEPIKLISPPPELIQIDTPEQKSPQTIEIPLEIVEVNASDDCLGATILSVPGGGNHVVNNFNVAAEDPDLNGCFWGNRSGGNDKGYRTAWYQFTAPDNGVAIVDTIGSTYDTVLAIYEDAMPNDATPACGNLKMIACNDDHNGFSSRSTFPARKGTTYLIEVADWQAGISGNANLLLSLQLEESTNWKLSGTMSLPRSRHATVIHAGSIYVIGGQTDLNGNPTITNRIDRFDALIENWVPLGQMPGVGLSNTTAVFVDRQASDGKCVDGCIYVPGGYAGGTGYDGSHWAYDIKTKQWVSRAAISTLLEPDEPFAWSTAVDHPNQVGYYLIGGVTSQPAITTTTQAHNKVFFYNIEQGQWLDNPPDLQTGRFGHMAARMGNTICVVGGIEDNLVLTPNGECFVVGGSSWVSMPALNEARYGAGSSVGPDGKWYIYGGANASHDALSSVEVYDPKNPAAGWSTLGVFYDLGATPGVSARAWPRGGFVANILWAMGGHTTEGSNNVLATIEKLFVGTNNYLFPIIRQDDLSQNNTLESALPVGFNTNILQNFSSQLDLYDTYYFDLPTTDFVNIHLSQIPNGSNYDVKIFDESKLLWGTGNNVGTVPENVPLTLAAGRYYVMVERVQPFGFPNSSNYKLSIQR